MRAFGQKFGGADAWVELSLHNRYKPVFEVGIGTAKNTPSGMNFTYTSPASVYFRIGANYNFLVNMQVYAMASRRFPIVSPT